MPQSRGYDSQPRRGRRGVSEPYVDARADDVGVRGRAVTGQPSGRRASLPGPPGRRARASRRARRWGALPGRTGVVLVVAGAAVGAVVTILAKSEPGIALGVFLVAGTVVAVLAVHPRAVHLVIPVPALAYVAAALAAGFVHDHAIDGSRTALALSAAQWVAGGFVAMAAATVVAIIATVIRRVASRSPDDRDRRPPPLARPADARRPRPATNPTSSSLWRETRDPASPHRTAPDRRLRP